MDDTGFVIHIAVLWSEHYLDQRIDLQFVHNTFRRQYNRMGNLSILQSPL